MSIQRRILDAIIPYAKRNQPVDYDALAAQLDLTMMQLKNGVKALCNKGCLFAVGDPKQRVFSLEPPKPGRRS